MTDRSHPTRTEKRPNSRATVVKSVLLGLGLMIVAAAIYDFARVAEKRKAENVFDVKSDIQNVVLNMDVARYRHPDGLFSVSAPAGWTVTTRPDSAPYDVVFFGPNQTDMSIMATPVEYNTLPELEREVTESERKANIAPSRESFFYKGTPAMKRKAKLGHTTVMAIDFVRSNVAHHIMFGTPPEYFDQYEPIFMDLFDTYEPGDDE